MTCSSTSSGSYSSERNEAHILEYPQAHMKFPGTGGGGQEFFLACLLGTTPDEAPETVRCLPSHPEDLHAELELQSLGPLSPQPRTQRFLRQGWRHGQDQDMNCSGFLEEKEPVLDVK